ncbi:ABC transporter ATP-binding protein [Aestuariivirga sp.]|jgi:ABC-2 type transport system ATP-binding protein|uniref:ABC transporter ATP-binding protein n=1 Tax=Aestuariivirga sp. TaxID=2650926 RepID=UPI0037831E54
MSVINVSGLTKRFGLRTAVDSVDLSVESGEIMGFLGPNGSGKTTTIRMVCGLLTPDAGSGTVLGFDVRRQSKEIKRHVGYMTQRFTLYEDLTVEENLKFVARAHGLSRFRGRLEATLQDMGLMPRRRQLAGTLSGGWKQRLSLAASLIHTPRILLLDEPTAGVDPMARREFWDEMHQLAQAGLTILVSTHYMDEAERCHRISFIDEGRMVATGRPSEVIASAALVTFRVSGAFAPTLSNDLARQPGVEAVLAFGSSLHVIGRDREQLRKAMQAVDGKSLDYAECATMLEDVIYHLVQQRN